MNSLTILALVFVGLTVIGVPLFASVGLTTALALYLIDIPYTLLAQTGYSSLRPFPLLTISQFATCLGRLDTDLQCTTPTIHAMMLFSLCTSSQERITKSKARRP